MKKYSEEDKDNVQTNLQVNIKKRKATSYEGNSLKKLIDTSNIIVYDMAKLWNLIVGTLYGDISLEYEYFWIKRGNCYKFFLGFYKVFKKRIKYGARQCTRIFFWYNNHTTLKSNWYFTILICPPSIFLLSPADAQMNEVNFEPWTFLKMISYMHVPSLQIRWILDNLIQSH